MPETILKIKNVSKIFPDGTCALSNINLSINKGEFTIICGRNGSGKSVLMTLIAGLDEVSSGEIISPEAGLIFQDSNAQILGETPEEDILFGLRNLNLKPEEINIRLEDALEKCGLKEKRNFQARLLSGGQKRRLAVAGVIAMKRTLIIFDEPFANLDWNGVKQVCFILAALKKDGFTIIVLTHELEKILGLADRFVILDEGKIEFNGTPEEGLTKDLCSWGIHNPLTVYKTKEDLFWEK